MNLKPIRIFIIFLYLFILCSCSNEPEIELNFIGDSIIARWDLDDSFPAYKSNNLGVGGSGIAYINDISEKEFSNPVVILTGTNNVPWLYNNDADIDDFAKEYIRIISNLKTEKIYLFSILPRELKNEPDLNTYIYNLNSKIKTKAYKYSKIIYIDVYDKFLYDNHIDYDLFEDNLHLSSQGYQILTLYLNKALRNE